MTTSGLPSWLASHSVDLSHWLEGFGLEDFGLEDFGLEDFGLEEFGLAGALGSLIGAFSLF
jgi:hypothetical protein